MKWSVSAARVFKQCPKKWYYDTVFANSKSTTPERKETYLLKHLQSIYAWRGKIVDQTISRFMIPRLNKQEKIDSEELLEYASWLMESQLSFAKTKLYKNCSNKPDSYNYCALMELENNGSLNEESIRQVSKEVVSSLLNLLDSSLISEIIGAKPYLIAQRTLQFQFANVNVKCTPDLIAFFKSRPPLIVDWKTESLGYEEHWLQLGIYGFALSKITPHKDFPNELFTSLTDPTKISLLEFQLLRNKRAEYVLTDEDITNIEDYIYTSSASMQQMTNNGKTPEQLIGILPKAKNPEICIRCKFKNICWKEPIL